MDSIPVPKSTLNIQKDIINFIVNVLASPDSPALFNLDIALEVTAEVLVMVDKNPVVAKTAVMICRFASDVE